MWQGSDSSVCGKLEWLNNYSGHIERLKNIKPVIKLTKPIKVNHRMHKKVLEQRKKQKICNDNLKLLKRILSSNRNKRQYTRTQYNRSTSLNRSLRNRVEQQIIDENKQILFRLRKAKSNYDSKEYKKLHQKHLLLTQHVSKSTSIFLIKSHR